MPNKTVKARSSTRHAGAGKPPSKSAARKSTTRKRKAVSLPTSIALTLDSEPRRWFANSLNEDIRDWTGTEAELVAKTIQLNPGYTPEMLARQGLAMLCQRMIATALSKKAADVVAGVAGAADDRLAEAFQALKKEGAPITPWRLGDRAEPKVSYRTAKRWLVLNGNLNEPMKRTG